MADGRERRGVRLRGVGGNGMWPRPAAPDPAALGGPPPGTRH